MPYPTALPMSAALPLRIASPAASPPASLPLSSAAFLAAASVDLTLPVPSCALGKKSRGEMPRPAAARPAAKRPRKASAAPDRVPSQKPVRACEICAGERAERAQSVPWS